MNEYDYDIAYFMQHGEYPKFESRCINKLTDDDIDFYIHENNEDSYFCWQGVQIPRWLL